MNHLLIFALALLVGCTTPLVIPANEVRRFDDPETGMRCYELIDRNGAPHFACAKVDKR